MSEAAVREWTLREHWLGVWGAKAGATLDGFEPLTFSDMIAEHGAVVAAFRAALADAALWKAALERYGAHKLTCDMAVFTKDGGLSHFDNEEFCTCGLSAALTAPARESALHIQPTENQND